MDNFLVVYFFAGAVQNFLFILNMRFVQRGHASFASVFAFLVSALSVWVLYDIITRINQSYGVIAIVAYAVGIAAGTYAAMKLKLREAS